MLKRKRSGPRAVPWGTPDVTDTDGDLSPDTTTFGGRLLRKFSTHFNELPLIP